jgi:adenylate cyclase
LALGANVKSDEPTLGSDVAHQIAIAFRQLGSVRLVLTILALAAAAFIARYSWQTEFFLDAEHALFDWRQTAAAPQTDQDQRIVLIAYTDETLIATRKRSPLDRSILAKALQRLDTMGAKSIGIDILIDQPQDEDDQLIAAFQKMKTPTFLAHASSAVAEDKILLVQQEFLEDFQKKIAIGNVRPTSIVVQSDNDNVLRKWALLVPGGPPRIPNAMTPDSSDFDSYTGSIVYRIPKFKDRPVFNVIPIDSFADDGLFQIPQAVALIDKQIRGKHVLIGGNIQDTDLFETPISRLNGKPTWGMDTFAHMLAQELDNVQLAPISNALTWASAIVVVIAGGLTAAGNLRPMLAGLVVALQMALMAAVPFWLASNQVDTYDLPAFGWFVGWFVSFATMSTTARALGSEQRKFAQSALGRYLPRDIAKEILRDPDSLSLKGENREIFVIFTDLEGFTQLSHAIEPEMVATLLNRYLEMLSNVVLQHGGTIDKFVGDAVVAFWGAPISRPDDGERATKAALAMFAAGEEFRRTVPEGVPLIGKTRVGLHHGEAIVGNFGGEGRIQYTALGDSMNTASRLESANKQTKSSILVSREAMELSGLDIFRPLGRIVLRGRATPVEVFEPVPDMAQEERQKFLEIGRRAIKGDVSAITSLADIAAKTPMDIALANFVYRLQHQEEGGYFVLD